MGLGDLFKRGTLLPRREGVAEPDAQAEEAGEDDLGVFDRATVIPDMSPQDLARTLSEGAPENAGARGGTQPSPAHPDGLDRRGRLASPSIASALAPNAHPTPPANSIAAVVSEPDNLEAAWVVGSGPLSSSATLDLTPLALQELAAGAPSEAPAARSARDEASVPFHTRDTVGVSDLLPQEAYSNRSPPGGAGPQSSRPTAIPKSPSNLSDLYAVGDFSGALAHAEQRLTVHPTDSEALTYAGKCRSVLTQMYASRLGDLKRPVRLLVASGKVKWLSIDHRAGFVLSLIDGTSSIEDVLDLCAMPNVEAMRIMVELLDKEIVAFG